MARIIQRLYFQMIERWSWVMYCLHYQFGVIAHHIGSNSNPDLDPGISRSSPWQFCATYFCFLTKGKYSNVYISSTIANEKNHFFILQLNETCIILGGPVGWGRRIHRLHLYRGVRLPQMSILDMTLKNLMMRLQQCWSFRECGIPHYCHHSQVDSSPEW